MPVKIGFAILTHNEPGQLFRLVKTLNSMFGGPPIVCHHDFSQCSLQEGQFPANVRFVHPHIVTKWGDITLPLAALRAFSLLRNYDQPEWFFLLSGSDYPVRPADEITTELWYDDYDAYLDNREILCPELAHTQEPGNDRAAWIPEAYYRYCATRFWVPRPSRKVQYSRSFPFLIRAHSEGRDLAHGLDGFKQFAPIRNRTINAVCRWFQFDRPTRIYGGDFWFHANAKAIDRLLDEPSMKRLVRYYRSRPIPDESLFHTALCSQADLRICKDQKRYADWADDSPHPKWLDESDLPMIIASGAFFARKVRDTRLMEVVETTLLGVPPRCPNPVK
jgi:hypothetical protein